MAKYKKLIKVKDLLSYMQDNDPVLISWYAYGIYYGYRDDKAGVILEETRYDFLNRRITYIKHDRYKIIIRAEVIS